VPVGGEVRALIDAGSVTFTGGTISLHDKDGVPLSGLGLGSTRLLIAGLQRQAAQRSTMVLIDELEHGLEPHRIIRLLGALGAKEAQPPLQVFMTSHSPVAVAELSAEQLYIVRRRGERHQVYGASDAGDVQGTIRAHSHALLASSVVVCEGASEIGLMRGLDQYFTSKDDVSLAADGAALVNGNGDETFARARALQSLGYRTAILRDSDKPAPADLEHEFIDAGGNIFAWVGERALEQELFASLPDAAAMELLELAIAVKDPLLIAAHIKTISKEAKTLAAIQVEPLVDGFEDDSRKILGDAAAKYGWLKSISAMERAGRDIVGPAFTDAKGDLTDVIDRLFDWIENGRR
jgi:putative ATP-dependent endonuclease of OLD family